MLESKKFNAVASPEKNIYAAEKIRSYLAGEQPTLSKEFMEKQRDVPLDEQIRISSDFRIEPPPKIYSETEKTLVHEHLEKNHGSSNMEEIIKDENQKAGFMFEILKTSILHKKMGKRFIVVRSSHYDDILNKVDNVLVDRKTGHTVCALDEVSPRSMRDDEMRKKQMEIKRRNFGFLATQPDEFNLPRQAEVECGMRLKYGISLTEGKISCQELRNLPIFLLSLDHNHLNEGLKQFKNGETSSESENKLFRYFLTILSLQIQELKLNLVEYKKLPDAMRNRIESLEDFLGEQGIK